MPQAKPVIMPKVMAIIGEKPRFKTFSVATTVNKAKPNESA